jgi:hypothetical protein
MDLHLNLADWRRHAPDWTAAVVAGFAAGAVLMVVELAWVAMFGAEGPWRSSHLVWVVGVALVTHYVLGVAFALVLAAVVAVLHREDSVGSIEALGIGFGALLYLVNFHGMTAWMPWFIEMRGWATFLAHLLFGLVAALLYWRLRRSPPVA